MGKLVNPKNTIDIINKYQFTIQKKYGQNFLIDSNIIDKIIKAADINKEDFILEIGPGIGTLTQFLCEHGGKVLAVEIDKKLIPVLDETLEAYDNVEVINEDILKIDLEKLIKEKNQGKKIKLVANLPYYITTPIIMKLFESSIEIENITIMVQKEVADRIQSGPGTKAYGSLSIVSQYYSKPHIAAIVPANCFIPRPKVDSAVLCLQPHSEPVVQLDNEDMFFKLVRSSFNQRRKTLANSINNAGITSLSKEEIIDSIVPLGKPENVRGEALTLEEFANLSNIIYSKTK